MKKFFYSLLAGTLMLTGCLENTQEVTIQEDGSGVYTTTNDLSAMLGLAKQMGGGDQMKEVESMVKDTTMSLSESADSIPNLTTEEKEVLRTGQLHINMNFPEGVFVTSMVFPFSKTSDIPVINSVSTKAMAETMKESMGGGAAMGGEMPPTSSLDDYYTLEFGDGQIKRTLNKEKYAGAESDEYLQGMKQAATMGLAFKATYIYNLPRPATEVEGNGIKLSDDKKKVTLVADIEDFFATPEKLEFKIKY